MSVSPDLIRATMAWIHVETDPVILALEIERTEDQIALLRGDIAANDLDACGGDLERCHHGIEYEEEVLRRLIVQGARLARATLPARSRPPTDIRSVRERMDRANHLDAFEVLDRVTGTWPRLGPQRAGQDEWWLCCPLPGHDENTPSFHMNDDGRWYCFGCGQGGGDKVSFVAAFMGSSQMAGLLLLERVFQL